MPEPLALGCPISNKSVTKGKRVKNLESCVINNSPIAPPQLTN